MVEKNVEGERKIYKGYIVGMRFVGNKFINRNNLCVDIIVNGKVESIIDNSLIDYYDFFNTQYDVIGSDVFVKAIPVDIYNYVGSENYTIDSNSVWRGMKQNETKI